MQNAKQAYCKFFSDEYVQVAENNAQHGDCIVLMEEDRLVEEDQVELENGYHQNNGKELSEEVSTTMHAVLFREVAF